MTVADLASRLRPGTVVISSAQARRLADHEADAARLRATIADLRRQLAELSELAQQRLVSVGEEHRRRLEAEARAMEYARLLYEERSGAAPVEGRRPELCRTLAECSGNRAAAERVTRIVAEAAVPTLDTILGEAS